MTRFGMTFQPGDLVIVPFPFSDLDATKKRPVLVLTAPDRRGDFIGLAVTSVPTERCALEVEVNALRKGALPKQSWIRLDKIFTLNAHRVEGICAQVTPAFRVRTVQALCVNLMPEPTIHFS
ncbi:MAG: type II toxin-antitoxin system PemK/MazF family toxin [Magnetococcales bacterium]|nr:type II toxin-antitoxin system PemK/MazF family toxin [Magnetococcales bacterium]